MGIYDGTQNGVNIPEIAKTMRGIEEKYWMNGIVQIVDPNIGDGTFDPWTNEDDGEPSVIWEGSARIQPLGIARPAADAEQNVEVRQIRFKIPLGAHMENGDPLPPLRAGLQVYVVDGGEDPALEQYRYIIENGLNSSLAWNRTIQASVDMTAVQGIVTPVVVDSELDAPDA